MNCKRSWKNIKFLASQQRPGENTCFGRMKEINRFGRKNINVILVFDVLFVSYLFLADGECTPW